MYIEQLLFNDINSCSLTMLWGSAIRLNGPQDRQIWHMWLLPLGLPKRSCVPNSTIISSCTTAENRTWNTYSEMQQNDKTCHALNGRKHQTGHCCPGAASELSTVHHLCYAAWHSVVEWTSYHLIFLSYILYLMHNRYIKSLSKYTYLSCLIITLDIYDAPSWGKGRNGTTTLA